MKTRTNKKKKNFFVKWWLVILLLLFIICIGGKQTYINFILKRDGKCTEAIVYSRKHYGGKGKVNTLYRFVWDNKTYKGSSSNDDKYRQTDKFFLTDEDLIIGDTIVIIFLESNPAINRSNSIVKKDCSCE